jgi:RecA-family ATPase
MSVEGPNGTARRAKAWRAHHGIADGEKLPLAFIRVDVDLFNDKKAAQAIVEAVGLLEAMTNLQCRAVAIDTVNAVTPGMDENSSADVGVFLRNLRTILAKTSAAVPPVHHTGKDESRAALTLCSRKQRRHCSSTMG